MFSKDIYTATTKENSYFHKTNLTHDMIFTKEDASTRDEKVGLLSIEYNIQYRYCVVSLIYLLSKRVDLYFTVHNLEKFSSNPGKINFEGLVNLLRYISKKIIGL